MAAQEVAQLTPGLRVLLLGEEMRTAWHDEGLDLLAVALQRLGHCLHLLDRHVLVAVAMDQQHRCVDLRHPQGNDSGALY